MSDIFGPGQGAPNYVTVRPTDTRVLGASDTFFQDCSSPTADDGTDIQAAFLNKIIASLSTLARGNGGSVVADPGADDGLLRSVQNLIQRGQMSYAVAGGTANALTATLAPAPGALVAGLGVSVKIAAANTGPATLNLNGLGASAITTVSGAALVGGELVAGGVAEMVWTGSAWMLMSAIPSRVRRTATAYYVSPAGNDSTGNGSASAPWATIQRAIDVISSSYDLAGIAPTINLAPGTYAPFSVATSFVGVSAIYIVGDPATPASCVISATNANCVTVTAGPQVYLSGITLSATGNGTTGNGVYCYDGGRVTIGANVAFGACAYAHMQVVGSGATISLGLPYRIVGSAIFHLMVGKCASAIVQGGMTITLVGTPAFSGYFFYGFSCALIECLAANCTFSGSATGVRYNVNNNAVINTGGGGANYLPGSGAGTTGTGGLYV